ncbi:MAG: hypothetical protein SAK29_32840 [Scytonema sp. PMC 1069.18]|nr:hypothetical protein [Scytonema sp. PMC 1069.18]MEC4888077.1 hypothetical protein [Scytonema sp. PMC 1070.18]
MFNRESKDNNFVKIVYAQITKNGKTELVPLKLYANGTLQPNT